jgi:hypothetical protein
MVFMSRNQRSVNGKILWRIATPSPSRACMNWDLRQSKDKIKRVNSDHGPVESSRNRKGKVPTTTGSWGTARE